jgi:hypothetical protein
MSVQHENKNDESEYQPNSKANVAKCTYLSSALAQF